MQDMRESPSKIAHFIEIVIFFHNHSVTFHFFSLIHNTGKQVTNLLKRQRLKPAKCFFSNSKPTRLDPSLSHPNINIITTQINHQTNRDIKGVFGYRLFCWSWKLIVESTVDKNKS